MSTPFVRHTGRVAALPRVNVDTDQIIPKQFLKRVERTGFGPSLFYDWRFHPDGTPDPTFELNRPEAAGASVLLAGANFGCGSSREHAVWALQQYGFRAVLSVSFADIFYANSCQNGFLAVRLPGEAIAELFDRHKQAGGQYDLTVDLEALTVTDAAGFRATFAMDPYQRDMLLKGLDEIGRTLLLEDQIATFERGTSQTRNAERGTAQTRGSSSGLEPAPNVPRSHFRVPRSDNVPRSTTGDES